jgi:hypothetical protein
MDHDSFGLRARPQRSFGKSWLTLVVLVVLVALLAFSARTARAAPADVAGDWLFRGIAGQVAHIETRGDGTLTATTEKGDVGQGRMTSDDTFTVSFSFGNVIGNVSPDGRTITWSNGERWTRAGEVPPGPGGGSGGPNQPPTSAVRLQADVECDPEPLTLVISDSTSTSCTLWIRGYNTDTVAPVIVDTAPIDSWGNHDNGVQVTFANNGSGQGATPYSMAPFVQDRGYPWVLFFYACPNPPAANYNCERTGPPPSTFQIVITVSQAQPDGSVASVTIVKQGVAVGSRNYQSGANVGGGWNTNFGAMSLGQSGQSVTGDYSTNDELTGTLQGNVLTGYWIQGNSAQQCQSQLYGSSYWGKLQFVFNGDSFQGNWSYCDQTTWSGVWTGTRAAPPDALGSSWSEDEVDGWHGIWNRIPGTNTFIASFLHPDGQTTTSNLRMDLNGANLHVYRWNAGTWGTCDYYGVLSGGQVSGSYSCTLQNGQRTGSYSWRAAIQ